MPESAQIGSGATHPRDYSESYSGGTETSVEAHAQRNLALLDERKRKILTHLRCLGPATADLLMTTLEIPHQSIGTIVLELMDAGEIHRPGKKGRTKAGRKAWLLVIGPGTCVGRPPRDFDPLALLRRFKRALETGGLDGPARLQALKALEEAGL